MRHYSLHEGRVKALNFGIRLLVFALFCGSIVAQQNPTETTLQPTSTKTLIVERTAKSASEVAIPPATSVKVDLLLDRKLPNDSQKSAATDVGSWLAKVTESNGLEGVSRPWHLVLSYDVFDGDGDNVHSGTYEELWASPKKFKRTYKSDNLNQTDFANENGRFRVGDQSWPGQAEAQVRAEVVDPFSYARTLNSVHASNTLRDFAGYKLDCTQLQGSTAVSDPTQYCFDDGSEALRYVRGFGWYQTTYNDLVHFQGRSIARSVTVTDGGKPYLKIHIDSLDEPSSVADEEFMPPPDAMPLSGKRVSGVMMRPTKTVAPQWPASFRGRSFTVQVSLVVGKDGHVIDVHATSGPDNAARICEDAIRKWIYPPYKVQGEPVEVEAKSACSYQ